MRKPTKTPNAASVAKTSMIRCAVYTRKSSEEGLEQSFNSLDAQREACEAYVASQKSEEWTVLPLFHDDGEVVLCAPEQGRTPAASGIGRRVELAEQGSGRAAPLSGTLARRLSSTSDQPPPEWASLIAGSGSAWSDS